MRAGMDPGAGLARRREPQRKPEGDEGGDIGPVSDVELHGAFDSTRHHRFKRRSLFYGGLVGASRTGRVTELWKSGSDGLLYAPVHDFEQTPFQDLQLLVADPQHGGSTSGSARLARARILRTF